ncbi:hypothetical protein Pla108_42220 [Botrimarina colliarenosi]|uniref:Uncharacterized protein n=1 Tax=Botrimarina colliarenosi TaxID=2528001 RepID=A0A5C5ZYZ7_9BACT|nr:hypothetical protein Pla108_42220 [Botrimarina colliarenosi]
MCRVTSHLLTALLALSTHDAPADSVAHSLASSPSGAARSPDVASSEIETSVLDAQPPAADRVEAEVPPLELSDHLATIFGTLLALTIAITTYARFLASRNKSHLARYGPPDWAVALKSVQWPPFNHSDGNIPLVDVTPETQPRLLELVSHTIQQFDPDVPNHPAWHDGGESILHVQHIQEQSATVNFKVTPPRGIPLLLRYHKRLSNTRFQPTRDWSMQSSLATVLQLQESVADAGHSLFEYAEYMRPIRRRHSDGRKVLELPSESLSSPLIYGPPRVGSA